MSKKAKADLDDGYVRIANALFQKIYTLKISNREMRVLLFIIYQTYGYNHKERSLTNSYIGAGVGITQAHASEAVKKLVKYKIVNQLKNGKRNAQTLGINTHLDEWVTTPETGSSSTTPGIGSRTTPRIGSRTTPGIGKQYNTDIYQTEKNQTECVGAAQAPPPHTPDFLVFERLWNEWKYSQAGKNRITKKQRQEIEKIGYYRMADAAERYYQDFESRTTKNNVPLSARTWFEGAYEQYLPTVDTAGYWFDVKKQLRKGDERV